MSFDDLPPEEQDWIDAYLDGTIAPEDFDTLQDRMLENPSLRANFRRYLGIDNFLATTIEPEEQSAWQPHNSEAADPLRVPRTFATYFAAIAAAFALLLAGWLAIRSNLQPESELAAEASAAGFAVLRHLMNPEWLEPEQNYREGDVLQAERLQLRSGTAEIQFFSGAIMTIEGPADLTLISAWEASCREGAIRMNVPPAARGFKLQAPSTEIIDLGTEFGLQVKNGVGQVEVFDGEISVRHRQAAEQLMQKGAAFGLPPDGPVTPIETETRLSYPDNSQWEQHDMTRKREGYANWQAHRQQMEADPRLILYSAFDAQQPGAVVLAEPVDGRWPGLKSALEFRRPGARVRVNIPGTFSAYTFSCWVRIDSLDRKYNALFMGDGYENGEPHWQIRHDGKLMLSVMVDDTRPSPYKTDAAGWHYVYFSPPIWDLSMSGQWMHLASVFDPANRQVSHYVNGKRIQRESMEDDYFIDRLRIGNGEMGNWGQPFRKDPSFAIRNLNGRMDEFALFKSALSDNEIHDLFTRSRARQN